jgi:hypothetical protein
MENKCYKDCNQGEYFLSNSSEQSCQSCSQNCKNCLHSSIECTECHTGTVLVYRGGSDQLVDPIDAPSKYYNPLTQVNMSPRAESSNLTWESKCIDECRDSCESCNTSQCLICKDNLVESLVDPKECISFPQDWLKI